MSKEEAIKKLNSTVKVYKDFLKGCKEEKISEKGIEALETALNYIKKTEGQTGQKSLIMRKQGLIENDDEIKTKITLKLIDRCKETAPNNSCECCCCNEAECLGSLYLRLTTDIQKGV